MSLTQALNTSLSGLRVTQQGLALVASNVANAETPGFVRKTLTTTSTTPTASGVGVRTGAIGREIDQYILKQLRLERSGGAYADVRADFYARLQTVFGEPGSAAALESVFNTFTESLQALATSPELYATRSNVLNAAQTLAQQLNGMSADIQGLRSDAEYGLAEAAALADDALQHLADINRQLTSSNGTDLPSATLLDQRDRYLDVLSGLMDVRVLETGNNQVSVFTSNGLQLLGNGAGASRIAFDAQGTVSAGNIYSADAGARSLGTLTLTGASGNRVDLLATGAVRSGRIAALVEMRDSVLTQAQAQLDALAASMSQALSDVSVAGTAVSAGSQSGYDIDISGMLAGNSVRVSYTDQLTGSARTVTLTRVNDASVLPLPDTAAGSNNRVVGIDFSGGMASITAQIAAALGANFDVSTTGGSTLRLLGANGGFANLTGVTATKTTTALTGSQNLAFFVDGAAPYAGAMTASGPQLTGLAARISVNAGLLADPAKLVAYQAQTAAGDPTRPNFIFDRLTSAALSFSPAGGIGSASQPFEGTLPAFLRQVIAQQGQAAAAASNLQQGQEVVLNALKARFNEASGVNIDQEMANLLNLQNAYGANARVMTAVKDLFELLMNL